MEPETRRAESSIKPQTLSKFLDTPHEHIPPWEGVHGSVIYLETGRQVLGSIAAFLERRGVRTIVMPGYFCETMASPFLVRGWEVIPTRLHEDLSVGGSSIWRPLVHAGRPFAALFAEYFGRRATPKHQDYAEEIEASGNYVIEDETHRVFEPGGVTSSFTFGSLRKLLPVADGAYLASPYLDQFDFTGVVPSSGDRWEPMDMEAEAGRKTPNIRDRFREANRALADDGRNFKISARSKDTLARLDYFKMAEARKGNATALEDTLTGSKLTGFMSGREGVPSHYVIATNDAVDWQWKLAERGVFAPVHWPRPIAFRDMPWRNDLVSIPIDHRYGGEDMEYVGRTILKIETEASNKKGASEVL